MKRLLHLVDSRAYVLGNCFQHQLLDAFKRLPDWEVHTVAYDELGSLSIATGAFDSVVSCLKQRTLFRHATRLRDYVGNTPIVVYDQDPWESFYDGAEFKGAYQHIASQLNVKTFAVTTQWWADHVASVGLPSTFVKMWVIPQYCSSEPSFEERNIAVGFIGALHPYRRQLFETLEDDHGILVNVQGGGHGYQDYLRELSKLQVYIHSEDAPLTINGSPANLNVGLWIKDIEAASRGCFSIRNRGDGSDTYLTGIKTVLLYDDPVEVPSLLEGIRKMDAGVRQATIDEAVEFIRGSDRWLETAHTLVG
jgi:hypothetical protein